MVIDAPEFRSLEIRSGRTYDFCFRRKKARVGPEEINFVDSTVKIDRSGPRTSTGRICAWCLH